MSYRIVLVEDDQFLSSMYVAKMDEAGFEVEVASSGKEGLELVKKIKPDLILLDLVLPEMDGYNVLENIKKDKTLRRTKVVVLSNLGEKEDIEKGLKLGASEYIIKSHFTPTEVVLAVKKVLDGVK